MSDARVRSSQPDPAGPAGSAGPAQPSEDQPGSGAVTAGRTASSRAAGWLVVVPALAELVVGGYRIGVPSLWRDEAATISGSQRSLSAIAAMARHQDAVHAPYYVLMHAVIAAGGTSPAALRLPSLIAMTLAVGLTGALARRLAIASGLPGATAIGVLAGLALTAVPLTTRYAQEARPYALASLCAVAASYAFVRALASRGHRWWVLYAAALLLTGLFNLFAALIAVAHGVSLLWLRRAGAGENGQQPEVTAVAVKAWLAAGVAVAVLLSPLIVLSAGQASQLSWVRRPGLGTLAALVRDFAGTTAAIPVVAVLALLGCAAGLRGREGAGRPVLTAVALPWLTIPPVVLLAVSLVRPYYVERYVLFCLPALAVLVAAGLVWLTVLARRAVAGRGLRPGFADVLAAVPAAVLALLLAGLLIGPQREIRQVSDRPDNLAAAAAVVARNERPGDAILYLPRDTSVLGVAYPGPFRHLRDIGLGRSALSSATLRGIAAPSREVAARLAHVRRLWTVRWAHPLDGATAPPAGMTRLLAGLHLLRTWRVQSLVLRLYAGPSG
jgi:mannosyltransferase